MNGNSKAVLLEMADKDDCAAKHDSERPFSSEGVCYTVD